MSQPGSTSSSSGPKTEPVRDSGLDAPTWRIAENGEYSLDQLAPFRFHKALELDRVDNGLRAKNNAFSFSLTRLPLFDTDGEYENCFAVRIECPAIKTLKQSSEELRNWLSEVALHCGAPADINLPEHLRADFAMHPEANKYRFIYPIQPDPDPVKARRLIAALIASPVPDFIKNLMLIGGYVYYRENANGTGTTLLQVKPFSANTDATEILATGRALDARDILPQNLIEGFERGVKMTDGKWQPGLDNLLCSSVNKITAPFLVEHLTHFGYVPQSLYAGSTKATNAARYGAFIYRTKAGKLQLVPIGGNFGTEFKPLDRTDKTEEEMQQIYKQHTFASLFYPSGGDNASWAGIEMLLNDGMIERRGNSQHLQIPGPAGVRYTVQAVNRRTLTICKIKTSEREERTAHIDNQGQISGADIERFTELLNEVYPHLMKRIFKVSGDGGRIYTIKESIDFASTEHLKEVINIVSRGGDLSVNYFDLFLHAYIAIDAGGVRRDYISKLFIALLRHSDLFEEENGFYKLKATVDTSNVQQRELLQNIGTFLAWILNQEGAFPLGRSLSSEFFKCLSTCLDTNITEEKLLKLFVDCSPEKLAGIDYKTVVNCLNLPQPPPVGDPLRDAGLNALLIYSFDIDSLSDLELPEANAKIQRDWNAIRSLAKREINKRMHDILTPYQVIARFLQNSLRVYSPRSYMELDLRLQGQTDLAEVRDAIVYDGPIQAVRKKAEWIKGWLTDQNVGQFLLAATGSPALGPGQRVSLNSMSVAVQDFWPVYHACSKSIDMPHGQLLDSEHGAHKAAPQLNDPSSFLRSFQQGLGYALASNGFTQG